MREIQILQAARLKGRLSPGAAAACASIDEASAEADLAQFRERGLVKGDSVVRLTPEGKEHLFNLIETERADVQQDALAAAYDEFDDYNNRLKAVVTDWQLIDGAHPNDHTDTEYDARVIDRLVTLHHDFAPLVQKISDIAPRLAPYNTRFANAIEQVQSGDTSFVASPIGDSYHTIWFEFHEELIGLLGLSRAEEAAAGRAE
jgi:pyruvate,orthophosphate dikinase